MTDSDPPKCPVCPRVRRHHMPLCNVHMRRVGQPLIDKYFARKGHAQHAVEHTAAYADSHEENGTQAIARTAAALRAVEAEIEACAREYDRIRELGLRPRWDTERNRWVNPREHARDVLESWHHRHRFGLDMDNDRHVLEQIAAELFPQEAR